MESYNVVVIGGGSGGLVVAAGAAGLGARAALVEKHKMGGDCLNYGCVPSKALLHAAKAKMPFDRAVEHVRAAQATIAPHDSVERFTGLGVDVRLGTARLRNAREVEVGETGEVLRGRHIVLATGSRPRIPDVPGLEEAGYHTNETIFDLESLPSSLLVIGGGPIGVELGQAFSGLGSRVTIVNDGAHVLSREDPDVAEALAGTLRREGIALFDRSRVDHVESGEGKKVVRISPAHGGDTLSVEVEAILVAAGRSPNVEGLNLDAIGVARNDRGIKIDGAGRTSIPKIWAVGDVAGPYLFTHWAGHQARTVLRNILFPFTAEFDSGNVPWVTYTQPEIARVGLNETDAQKMAIEHRVFRVEFSANDRAIADQESEGYFSKVVSDGKGRILGATIVHPRAGDLLGELLLAKKHGITLSQLSSTIHPYPSLSEIHRSVGDAYMRTRLSASMKKHLTRVYKWLRS
jgi:pyruvate/2-oxoglutarate dehydrogenase complex dihydrolipoamide dehydrogenase (E3) component